MLKIVLLTLGDPNRLTGGYLFHRRMAELAPQHNAELDLMPFPDGPFPLGAASAPKIMHAALQRKPDVLVLDSIAAWVAGPVLAMNPPPVPLAAMMHQPPGGIDHGPLRTWLQALLDRLAYRHARVLMVASESLQVELHCRGFEPDRMIVVPPGCDPAPASSERDRRDLRRGHRVAFLCVANWIARKGIHSLLQAFARLPRADAMLHLAGDNQADPAYARRIRRLLERLDLSDRVVDHGPVSRDEVAALYASADAFVLPSVREPYGTVYGEAMAAGLPVVGWRAGNLPYLARDGEEGLLVTPGRIGALSAALLILARDEALRTRLGRNARERARSFPTWEQTAERFFGALSAMF